MYLYLDESGDLGFDFVNKRSSNYFIITLLVCNDQKAATTIKKAVERTLKNKIHNKKRYKYSHELKGARFPLEIKSYFYRNAAHSNSWKIYSIIFDKKIALKKLTHSINKHRIYNVLSNHLLREVDFSEATTTINLFVDRSKDRDGIKEFDTMLQVNLDTVLPLNVPLNISHVTSHENYGVQAVDLFCWGIFRKYVNNDNRWYDIFKHKIVYEEKFRS